jgi:hypothetical protein
MTEERVNYFGNIYMTVIFLIISFLVGRITTLIIPAASPVPEQVVIKGVLTSADFYKGTHHDWHDLKFEGGQQLSVSWGTVPLYVGQYQEILCEKNNGVLQMVRNNCPAHEAACQQQR